MRLAATDDGHARSHDDVAALLRAIADATGARLAIARPALRRWSARTGDAARVYTLTVHRHGRADVAVAGTYALPVRAAALAARVRAQVEDALKE